MGVFQYVSMCFYCLKHIKTNQDGCFIDDLFKVFLFVDFLKRLDF
jgi:hypothetical protein